MTDSEAQPSEEEGNDIAIVGMACRYPGAANHGDFWRNLAAGIEGLTELSESELVESGVSRSVYTRPNYVPKGMFLAGYELFDPAFFGMSPLEGDVMDPQHRQFLECAWEAFEDAGHPPSDFDGAIGVYAGSGHNAYFASNVLTHHDILENQGYFLLRHTGNDKDFLATRVSYCFDLTGPAVSVQTACSTSLVAVHLGAQSLLNGECDMVLAGGSTVEMPHRHGYEYKENEILSVDGRCRPFEASSTGTVFGSGVGCVLLRRLADAIGNGDNIHAVIRSTAINNDGAQKVSYLAPSVSGQAAVAKEALELAEVEPDTVGFIECHGTGTQIGDPIEIAALDQAYGSGTSAHRCAIGSVKSNIGHTDNAAGIAGLIKAVLCLKNGQIPPTLHYASPNPNIDFASTPFHVVNELTDWHSQVPRRAAVSSLGVGGTNAHVILEEAPQRDARSPAVSGPMPLVLSARTEASLNRYTAALSEYLGEHPETDFSQLVHTLATGRERFGVRRTLVAHDAADAAAQLDDPETYTTSEAPESDLEVAFMFAGGGAQYPGMGQALYENEPVYRDAFDECARLLEEFIDFDLRALVFADDRDAAANEMKRPSRTLPCLFATQYACARLWQSRGVSATALIGHSMGENTAACIAGVLSLRDALGLVALRGRLFEKVAPGGMLSVELDQDEVREHLSEHLDIAAVNAPGLVVVSGPADEITRLAEKLGEAEIGCQRIHIEVAAHSHMLEPILEEFRAYLRSIRLSKPDQPILSNLTGTWLTETDACDPDYWVRHLRHTVRFADGVGELASRRQHVLLEVGPGRVLATLAGLHPDAAGLPVINSLPRVSEERDARDYFVAALAGLWRGNASIDWSAWFGEPAPGRISLPTYRFDHTRHFLSAEGAVSANARREGVEDWLYEPIWRRRPSPKQSLHGESRVLAIGSSPLIDKIVALAGNAHHVGTRGFEETDGRITGIDIAEADHYVRLVRSLDAHEIPHVVIVGTGLVPESDLDQRACFDPLLYLAQAFSGEDVEQSMSWLILAGPTFPVSGETNTNASGALSLGACGSIEAELPNVKCSWIDTGFDHDDALVEDLLREALAPSDQPVAYRKRSRFIRTIEPRILADSRARSADMTTQLRDEGVYLITGGLGGLGLLAAREMADRKSLTLILASRRKLPAREHWQSFIDADSLDRPMLEAILQMEELGSRVILERADFGDAAQVEALRDRLMASVGRVNGIIHTSGLIADELIQRKDRNTAASVIAAKAQSAVNLAHAFQDHDLDFTILYSSTSAFAGLPGQIDYAAANSFLDAWAELQQAAGVQGYASINWPAWNETGVAVATAAGTANVRQPPGQPITHPLLDRVIETSDGQSVYSTLFSARDWIVDEHRVRGGNALIPGAGYIEMAHAAFVDRFGAGPVELTEVANLLPFFIGDAETRELRLRIEGAESDAAFEFFDYDDDEKIVYVSGRVARAVVADERLDIDSLAAGCNTGTQHFDDEDHHPYMLFGDRWRSLSAVRYGAAEAVIDLTMPAEYSDETAMFTLHPAMLDMAVAGAQVLIPDYQPNNDLFVPVRWGRLTVSAPLSAACHAHVAYRAGSDVNQALFDVSIVSPEGWLVAAVSDFELQRVDASMTSGDARPAASEALSKILSLGISNAEGLAVLASVLAEDAGPNVAVSAWPLRFYLESLRGETDTAADEEAPAHDADADPDIGAVETTLEAHPGVGNAIVRSFVAEDDSRRLIAWFVSAVGEAVTVSDLRRHARSALPAELAPRHFVELHSLPQDADGETDRRALTDPFAPVDTYVAPATTTERQLAQIWEDLLGIKRVSRTENFYDIGGHSLVSVRAIVKAEKKLGVKLDQAKMALLSLEQLAAEVDAAGGSGGPTDTDEPTADENAGEKQGMLGSWFSRRK